MKYKMQSNGGGFAKGSLVTDDELKEAGADIEFWKRTNTIKPATAEDEATDTENGKVTDGQNKDRIEAAIRKASAQRGRALTTDEQDLIAAGVTEASRVQTENAAAKESGQPAPTPPAHQRVPESGRNRSR